MILFADDQVVVQGSEDEVQEAILKLLALSHSYNYKISIMISKILWHSKVPVQ